MQRSELAEVVRARIAELNARIDALHISIDRLKTIAQLNYFLIDGSAVDLSTIDQNTGDQTQEYTEQ